MHQSLIHGSGSLIISHEDRGTARGSVPVEDWGLAPVVGRAPVSDGAFDCGAEAGLSRGLQREKPDCKIRGCESTKARTQQRRSIDLE